MGKEFGKVLVFIGFLVAASSGIVSIEGNISSQLLLVIGGVLCTIGILTIFSSKK